VREAELTAAMLIAAGEDEPMDGYEDGKSAHV
jgi:hypothetical protein